MEDLNLNVIPVLIGADQNCYNVARAFHEAYGLVSHAMGRYAIGITQHTSIVKFHRVENLNQDDTFMMAIPDSSIYSEKALAQYPPYHFYP